VNVIVVTAVTAVNVNVGVWVSFQASVSSSDSMKQENGVYVNAENYFYDMPEVYRKVTHGKT
jgi:hypothetical protein